MITGVVDASSSICDMAPMCGNRCDEYLVDSNGCDTCKCKGLPATYCLYLGGTMHCLRED